MHGISLALAAATLAGPLNPPAGSIAPTPGPEPRIAINQLNTTGDADSVYHISKPGSYFLTQNLKGDNGKVGIEIAASNVTIDLMGYNVFGLPGVLSGIATSGGAIDNITIRNGVISDWDGSGIDLVTAGIGTGVLIEDVHVSGNALNGMILGKSAVVQNCTASNNTQDGLRCDEGAAIAHCSAHMNRSGIFATLRASISNCSSNNNSFYGIRSGSESTISDCAANGNDIGIEAQSYSTVSHCTASQSNVQGIAGTEGCRIVDCIAQRSGEFGISGTQKMVITGCTVLHNTLDGIYVQGSSTIMNNTCDLNGFGAGDGAGIRVAGPDCRIEGNLCTNNDRGIHVDGTNRCVIVKNICGSNTSNFELFGGNFVGEIVNPSGSMAIFSGNGPLASTLNTTDPNANFSH